MDFIEAEIAPITSISGEDLFPDGEKSGHIASEMNTKWVIISAFIFISVLTWVNTIQSLFNLYFNRLIPKRSKDEISQNDKYYDFIQQLLFAVFITIITILIYYSFFIKNSSNSIKYSKK